MRTTIDNEITVVNPSLALQVWARDNLVVINPSWMQLKKLGKDFLIAKRHVPEKMYLYKLNGTTITLPFGCLNAVWEYIKDDPYELKFNDNGIVMDASIQSTQPLYDYQEEAVKFMLNQKGGVLNAPAGSGKTNCGIEIAHRIGRKTLWLTHTSDLLKQSMSRAKKLFPELQCGTITEGEVHIGKDITFATVQTLSMINPKVYAHEFDVVITDEVHHVCNSPTLMKMFGKVIESIPARYKYGISATAERNDSLTKSIYTVVGMNNKCEFAPMYRIDRADTQTLDAVYYQVKLNTPFDYSILNEDGTHDTIKLVNFFSENEERNNNIVKAVLDNAKDRKQVVLCQRVSQCEVINQKLIENGLRSEVLVGKISGKKRDKILNNPNDWDVIVATMQLAKEGLDVPILSVLHLANVVGNQSDTIQAVGRVERVCQGKPIPIVYDYVDINYPYCIGKAKKRQRWIEGRK